MAVRESIVGRVWQAVITGCAGLFLQATGCQRHFIYFPSKMAEERLLPLAAESGLEPWRDVSGNLVGWRDLHADGDDTALAVVFHGNAGMALDRQYYRDGLERASGGKWWVHIFEYPGYGSRDGRPGESQIYTAAREALKLLFEQSNSRIFLVGESIGTGTACRMAAEFRERIAGLLLITPFTSLADVAAYHYPVLPVRLLLNESYDNVTALRHYDGPVAILLAERDEVVPAKLGRELYEKYPGSKLLDVQAGRSHNTLDLSPREEWWGRFVRFLDSRAQSAQGSGGEPAGS